jgi:hypothetical protein
MKIRSSSTIAQLKHQSSFFKQHLLHEHVHINNAQLGLEEGIVMGWMMGSHPAFTHHDGMRDDLTTMVGNEVEGPEWALYRTPKRSTTHENQTMQNSQPRELLSR